MFGFEFCMLTREKLQRGEGELVAKNPLIGLRKRASHRREDGIRRRDFSG
jgi:hypothetical protein